MKTRSVLIALFGLWFTAAPWMFGYTGHAAAVWMSVGFGIVQVIASLCSLRQASGDSPPNLITFVTGIIMAVLPFTLFTTGHHAVWITAAIGVLTLVLSFTNLSHRQRA